jgi:hypothetical protein
VITESEVKRSFQRLFQTGRELAPDVFEKAEALLDELRPESPLRYRLQEQIEELRELHDTKAS